jgi:hypothetical protein
MPNYKQEFKEVGRVRLSDTTEAVLSEVVKSGKKTGYQINTYLTTETFTGYTRGLSLPEEMVVDYLSLFSEEDLQLALDSKEGK